MLSWFSGQPPPQSITEPPPLYSTLPPYSSLPPQVQPLPEPVPAHRNQYAESQPVPLSVQLEPSETEALKNVSRQVVPYIAEDAEHHHRLMSELIPFLENGRIRQAELLGSVVPTPRSVDHLSAMYTSISPEYPLVLMDIFVPEKFGSCLAAWELPRALSVEIRRLEATPSSIEALNDIMSSFQGKEAYEASLTGDVLPADMFLGLYRSVGGIHDSIYLIMGSSQGCSTTSPIRHARRGTLDKSRTLCEELVVDVACSKRELQQLVERVALKAISSIVDYVAREQDKRVEIVGDMIGRFVCHSVVGSDDPKIGLGPTYYSDVDYINTVSFGPGVIHLPSSTEEFLVVLNTPITGMCLVTGIQSSNERDTLTSIVPACITRANHRHYSLKTTKELMIENWRLRNVPHEIPHPDEEPHLMDLGAPCSDDVRFTLCNIYEMPDPDFVPLKEKMRFIPIAFCGPVPEETRC